jgi:glycosyltransferase involved in cell wall biosynthesis
MKVSVVMTTYNGSRFIRKQLDSIRDQTKQPDEVIIADDLSTDCTYEMVKEYIEENNLRNWKIYQNDTNLGVHANFFSAMGKTTGNLIFFSDQDDIWEKAKIEEMTDIISRQDDMLVLMCKENRIDEEDRFIRYTEKETKRIRKVDFSEEVRECMGSGHLIVIKRKCIEQYADSLRDADMFYDIPICIVAAAHSGLFQYDRRLVQRRLHGNNTSGIKKNHFERIKDFDIYVKGREARLGYFQYIIDNWEKVVDESHKSEYIELSKAIALLEKSVYALNTHKMRLLFKEIISKNKYLNKSISLANVLVLSRKVLVGS